ncbi:MAG: helix-turn-helix domain-containing protein [Pyrobaculum sp.]|uniref:Transcription regulator TrmB N-terminal domain-containing protein n=2 Tax=Pyrobaculum arsenaticum TaxID=121277 RepID=A4WI47_PYRAR|nr:helix-turn-helix domain-containing protein [Pyrobaculum arsenaticum]ABP50064.1 conserved hypothetical protein [Pyrobaculum arsenaticum DSM 13514]MCY0889656.1 transcriptional regulator [Pyrobaculum arsenaticum]NYR14967.1 TrmB family transcriptional regulator [Pyrobaculum arsenaticum]
MEFKAEYYVVLEALSRGGKTAEEVAEVAGIEVHDAEAILSTLMAYGLVERREKGLVFRKEVYTLTERGWEVLEKWRHEVRDKLQKAAELRREGLREEADELVAPLAPALPALLAMGMLDLALYSAALGAAAAVPEEAITEEDTSEVGDFGVGDDEL